MMENRFKGILGALVLILATTPLVAEDLTDADQFLCSPIQATRCFPDGDCVTGPPWNWNIPQFIVVDLIGKMLSTTEASPELRTTPIRFNDRADGQIFLQGVERGRAFSLVITEETGMASIAVATDGMAVSVFGVCTPM
jgi:hypothetical protein